MDEMIAVIYDELRYARGDSVVNIMDIINIVEEAFCDLQNGIPISEFITNLSIKSVRIIVWGSTLWKMITKYEIRKMIRTVLQEEYYKHKL